MTGFSRECTCGVGRHCELDVMTGMERRVEGERGRLAGADLKCNSWGCGTGVIFASASTSGPTL